MKFGTICIENFLAISNAAVDLADRGLISIEGVNEDDSSAVSNGAGKSSIADALCWALYGVTARGEGGDAVINAKAGKGTRVQVQAIEGDVCYDIQRHRKHKEGKNALRIFATDPVGGCVELTKGVDRLTQEVVEDIIGCTYEVFRSSIYAGQEQMPDLPGMTDKQLKVLVEEAAGVTILEKAYEEARTRARTETQNLAERTAKLSMSKARLVDLNTSLDEAQNAKKQFVGECTVEAKKIAERAKELKAENVALAADLAKLPKFQILASIKAIDDKLAALKVEKDEERRLDKLREDAKLEETGQKIALSQRKRRIDEENHLLANIKDRVGKPCGECGKEICEHDLAETKKLAMERLRENVNSYRTLESDVRIASDAHKSAADALAAFRASMSDASALSAQRASLSDEVRQIEALEQTIQANAAQIERYKHLAKEFLGRKNPHDATVTTLNTHIAAVEKLIEEHEAAIKELSGAVLVADTLVQVFSPAGVRAHILDTVTPFLNAQTAKYLSTLSDGNIEATWTTLTKTAKGEFREKFAIEVKNSTGGGSFGLISGGEKRKVRIACALALQDLVASRASKPIELFIGDEIDDALDAAGLERLMMILQEKARERGSVFVISHNAGIKDWISNVITVTRKDGVSTLEEASV